MLEVTEVPPQKTFFYGDQVYVTGLEPHGPGTVVDYGNVYTTPFYLRRYQIQWNVPAENNHLIVMTVWAYGDELYYIEDKKESDDAEFNSIWQ